MILTINNTNYDGKKWHPTLHHVHQFWLLILKISHFKAFNMEFLKIRNSSRQVRADGSPFAVPFLVTKHDRYSDDARSTPISVKRDILVTGAHDSSKTRWLTRLHEQSDKIWTKSKSPAVWLGALRPLGSWSDSPAIIEWWNAKVSNNPINYEPWAKIPAWKRQELIPDVKSR